MQELNQEYLTASIKVPASMSHWDKVMDFIAVHAEALLNEKATIYKLRLACEEVFSNIMRETSDEREDGRDVSLWISLYNFLETCPPVIVVKIEDNGPPFDPKLNIERNVNNDIPLSEREIGGLGLFLVQQSAYEAEYDYKSGHNSYILSFKL